MISIKSPVHAITDLDTKTKQLLLLEIVPLDRAAPMTSTALKCFSGAGSSIVFPLLFLKSRSLLCFKVNLKQIHIFNHYFPPSPSLKR